MNIQLLEQYGLEFRKTTDGSHIITGHWLGAYIYIFTDIDDVSEFIDDLNLAINGQFNEIEDPDWGEFLGFYYFAEIRPNEFAVWLEGTSETIIPLEDMREILVCWKEFLES
jgi:hypothetical protein